MPTVAPPLPEDATPGGCPRCIAYTTRVTVNGVALLRVHHASWCIATQTDSDRTASSSEPTTTTAS